ncbi:uncharacterized protein VTP21DRAFT_8299 [Calcarisporiella thermophila]|uniref:uncharacterized protein n=1 Tax=Calcarisporiella thermophila TaxID=911321 RepID=UPI00374322BD
MVLTTWDQTKPRLRFDLTILSVQPDLVRRGKCMPGCDKGDACDGIFCYALNYGTGKLNYICEDNYDCGPDLSCDDTNRGGNSLPQCKRKYGGACETSSDCLSDLQCYDKKCTGKRKKGEACKETLECEGALVCNSGKCGDRVYAPVGGNCTSNFECETWCKDGICSERWNGCCTNDSDCKSGEWCYAGGVCCPMNSPMDSDCRRQAKREKCL